jgi:hypothetical protein
MTLRSVRQDNHQKILLLRASILLSLLISAVVFGYFSYVVFYRLEGKLLISQYNSIKDQFNFAVDKAINDKKKSMNVLAEYLESEFPNRSSWPYVAVTMKTFQKLSDPLIDMANSRTISFSPILHPTQVDEYENFSYSFFEYQGYPELGVSQFGKGISASNSSTGERYHDVDGSSAKGIHDILVPVFQIGKLDQNSAAVMFNIYSEKNRAGAIDFVLNCTNITGDCSAVTDFIYIVQDSTYRPAALMIRPIFTFDGHDYVVVGVVVVVFNWDDVLIGSVPNHVKGMDVEVESSSGEKNYFKFEGGVVSNLNSLRNTALSSFYTNQVDLLHTSFKIKVSINNFCALS